MDERNSEMGNNLIDPNRLREKLQHFEELYLTGSPKQGGEITYEITEIADSVGRLQEYLAGLNKVLENPPSKENLDEITRYLAYLQVEIYEQLLDHCEELREPLEEFLARMDPHFEDV
jgi:hypothetical protein